MRKYFFLPSSPIQGLLWTILTNWMSVFKCNGTFPHPGYGDPYVAEELIIWFYRHLLFSSDSKLWGLCMWASTNSWTIVSVLVTFRRQDEGQERKLLNLSAPAAGGGCFYFPCLPPRVLPRGLLLTPPKYRSSSDQACRAAMSPEQQFDVCSDISVNIGDTPVRAKLTVHGLFSLGRRPSKCIEFIQCYIPKQGGLSAPSLHIGVTAQSSALLGLLDMPG